MTDRTKGLLIFAAIFLVCCLIYKPLFGVLIGFGMVIGMRLLVQLVTGD